MKIKITCKDFIKMYHKDIDAFCNSLSYYLVNNTIEGLLAFMRYQGVNIHLIDGEMYLIIKHSPTYGHYEIED